ncbi:hypothetical protein GGS23DRAFT_460037 [Durotheca rogersii]|uniref:uncharacterized protein n=1 Tax=Durotheca rogersii TaxID=419775 RepID=UPI002220DC3A|nr:uncharacterized protein GGS23DRAFT_460037 [Durotheca rogersii]KAI5864712.1 hypothetical protein GGS23DRAFT_460037 [Durotheca rogersii]
MAPIMQQLVLSLLSSLGNPLSPPHSQLPSPAPAPSPSPVAYTDSLVAPVPAEHYARYLTFLAVGTRTFRCDASRGGAAAPYRFASFEYDLYDADADSERAFLVGRHVLMPHRDASGGNSIFYTANDTFTYWVGNTTLVIPDPLAASPLDMALERELRTEASEPKPSAGKYDLGVAVYATRFGAKGGNLPADAECTGERTIASETYYSMFKQVL